eukprot:CAMPEP_0202911790 /NCGR_PEP_ID=MMETSP1392-20130828/55935_1 /ASSEMBLY_ACC=CAM_ASM_000868 /TAXON_ID=225041 /ORGANISM="Chlamydomonas chlamydogama, Strain SAG 11-48b" /LENGTH=71 /DNA_ID=CAMNT_0049602431 /DNA_START=105 /DNA_END=320 /DNA_ORIENTATION=+
MLQARLPNHRQPHPIGTQGWLLYLGESSGSRGGMRLCVCTMPLVPLLLLLPALLLLHCLHGSHAGPAWHMA